MLQWIWNCRHFSKILFSFLLHVYPETIVLDHIEVLFFRFWGTHLIFNSVCTNLHSHQWCRRVPFVYMLANTCSFLIVAILTGRRWCLIVVLHFFQWLEMLRTFSCICLTVFFEKKKKIEVISNAFLDPQLHKNRHFPSSVAFPSLPRRKLKKI